SEEDDIITLTDKAGNLISWQGKVPENFSGLKISFKLNELDRALAQAVRVNIGGREYLGSVAAVRGFDGYLLAARPWDSSMAFLNQLLLDLALVFAVALIIAVAIGYFMASSLAGGIDILVNGIRRVADGVISHRVEISGSDELAEAGSAFNEMVDTLEKHRMIDDIWSREWSSAQQKKGNDIE
ncbi:MAG: HAMP domain-containing protein, partial [Candidatus Riflebacteria bacterium]